MTDEPTLVLPDEGIMQSQRREEVGYRRYQELEFGPVRLANPLMLDFGSIVSMRVYNKCIFRK